MTIDFMFIILYYVDFVDYHLLNLSKFIPFYLFFNLFTTVWYNHLAYCLDYDYLCFYLSHLYRLNCSYCSYLLNLYH